MKKLSYLAAVALVALLTACTTSDVPQPEARTHSLVTFNLGGEGFGNPTFTRAISLAESDMTDLWVFDFVAENCPDVKNGLHTVKDVPILMIVNDTRYGGICISFDDGSGYCIAPYSEGGAPLRWDFPSTIAVNDADPASGLRAVTQDEAESLGHSVGDWRNIVVHEFGGHCFARLGDEYWYNSVKSATSCRKSGR